MTSLEPAPAAQSSPVARALRPVDEAVRDQLLADLGERRLARLRGVVEDATFTVALHWLSSARRGSLDTKRGYVDDLAKVAEWAGMHFRQRPVELITRLDFATVTIWTVYAKSRGWSVRHQRRILSVLSSFFAYASKHGVAVSNPVNFEEHAQPVGTSQSGRPVGATRVLEMPQLASLQDACQTPEECLVFDLAHLHGLRESEIVNARVENIDRDQNPYRMWIERKRGQWIERELQQRTAQNLETHLDGREDGPVLTDPKTGAGKNRHQVIDISRRLARRGGLPSPRTITPHVLRASAITDLLETGKPLHEVQQWAGHASPKTTQGYWERRNVVKRDAALSDALATAIANASSGMEAEGPSSQEALSE